MGKIKIALIKEGKVPKDKRVALTPYQARQVMERFPEVDLVAQTSDIRCFTDQDYLNEGIQVVDSVDDCDILLGVKEVPIPNLIANKTYFFFSHTIKKQPYNQPLIKEVISKKIRLIDYETLTDETGKRIIAFGRWAGIVGAYNGIWTFGKRYNLFDIRRASECFDLEDLMTEYEKGEITCHQNRPDRWWQSGQRSHGSAARDEHSQGHPGGIHRGADLITRFHPAQYPGLPRPEGWGRI